MDKKGIAMGVGDRVKVLVLRLEAEVFAAELGNREWVSLIKCVSGNRYRPPVRQIAQVYGRKQASRA